MAVFADSINWLLRHEGGFVNNPDDRGKATNMGITRRTLSAHRAGEASADDVRELTREEAEDIYYKRYWTPMMLDGITSQKVAGAVFDFGVNSGTKQAIKTLQEACCALGVPLVKDGLNGPITLIKVNGIDQSAMLKEYAIHRAKFYLSLCRYDTSQRQFLYAWMRRTMDHS